MNIFMLTFLFISLLLYSSCGIFKNKHNEETEISTSNSTQPKVKNIMILDFNNKKILSPAIVYFSVDKNKDSIFTDDEVKEIISQNGTISINDYPNTRRVIKIEVPGYIPLIRSYLPGEPIEKELFLKQVKGTAKITRDSQSITFKTENVKVTIPSISRAFKEAKNVTKAKIEQIDPGKNPELMPANFRAYWKGPAILSSSGAIFVKFYDQNGWPIELPKGDYEIKIRIPPGSYGGIYDYNPDTPEIEIPLWYLNEREGTWEREEEIGYLVDEKDNKILNSELANLIESNTPLYVKGKVKHFSFINCDIPGVRAAICGKFKNFNERRKKIYIETLGLNWNGGQGGNFVRPDGTFCVPVPTSLRKKLPKERCRLKVQDAFFKWLADINDLANDPDLPQACKEEWEKALKVQKRYAYELYDFLVGMSNLKKFSQTDREAIRRVANKFKELVDKEEFAQAFDFFKRNLNIYGEKLSGEDFLKIDQKVKEDLIKNVTGVLKDVLGMNIPLQPEEQLSTTFKDFVINVVKIAASTSKNACVRSLVPEVTGATYDEVAKAIQDISQGQKVNLDTLKIASDSIKSFVQNLVEFDNQSKAYKLNEDAINCLKSIKGLSKYAEGLEKIAAAELSSRINLWLTGAQIVAAEIQEFFDLYEAQRQLLKKELAAKWDSANFFANRAQILFDRAISPECKPENFYKISSFLNYLKENELLNQCPNLAELYNSWKETEKDINKTKPTVLESLNTLSKAVDSFVNLTLALEELTNGRNFLTNWVNVDTGKPLSSIPSSGDPSSFGGFISQLSLTIPEWGIHRLPINLVTSEGIPTDLIPSPMVPIYSGNEMPALYIGNLDYSQLKLTPTKYSIRFSFNLPKGVSIIKVSLFSITGKHLRTPRNAVCKPQGNAIQCEFTTIDKFTGSKVDISIRVMYSIESNIINSATFTFKGITLKTSLNIPVNVFLCQHQRILKINVPKSIQPDKEYMLSAEIETRKFISQNACEASSIKWILGTKVIGEGNPLKFKTPKKEQLALFGNLTIIGAITNGSKLIKQVKIDIPNRAPEILSFKVPEVIAADKDSITVEAQVNDADGDILKLRWFSLPTNILAIEEGINSSKAIIAVKHQSKDIKGIICLKVSDFMKSKLKCTTVLVKRKALPPRIISVETNLTKLTAPASANFKVNYSSQSPLDSIEVIVEGAEEKSFSFKTDTFKIPLNQPGEYKLTFRVKNKDGLLSPPYSKIIYLTQPQDVNVITSGKIISKEGNKVKVALNLEGTEGLSILSYQWDVDGDDEYEYTTYEPKLTLELPQNFNSEIKVQVNTVEGSITTSIKPEKIQPLVLLNINPKEGNVPLKVNFSIKVYSLGTQPISYKYDFNGDGKVDLVTTSSQTNYVFTTSGEPTTYVDIVFDNGMVITKEAKIHVNPKGALTLINVPNPQRDKIVLDEENLYIFLTSNGKALLANFLIGEDFYPEFMYSLLNDKSISYIDIAQTGSSYVLLESGTFCSESTCQTTYRATCVFKLKSDMNVAWTRCFKNQYFRKLATNNNTIFLYSKGDNKFVLMSLDDGSVKGTKKILIGDKTAPIDYIYANDEYLYVAVGSGDKEILIKLDSNLNVIFAKEMEFKQGYYKRPQVMSMIGRGDSLYLVAENYLFLSTSAYVLFELDSETGEPEFGKVVLYKCPKYCYKLRDIKLDENYLYLLGSYYFWGGSGQVIIKLNKDNGDFVFAKKVKICQVGRCSDEAHSLEVDDQFIYISGIVTKPEKAVYLINLSKKNGDGCKNYISQSTEEDIGFEKYIPGYSFSDLDTSTVHLENEAMESFSLPSPSHQDLSEQLQVSFPCNK